MFGMGFTEILLIAVIAILFLGPDKLPSTMVEIAKFFRNTKKTLASVKDSIEEEMNVNEIKEEALAYKKQLQNATDEIKKVTDTSHLEDSISNFNDNLLNDDSTDSKAEKKEKKSSKAEEVTFKKKSKEDKKEDINV